MAFCDLSHTYHKQVTNVSPACFCHPTVGIMMSPLTEVAAAAGGGGGGCLQVHRLIVIQHVGK